MSKRCTTCGKQTKHFSEFPSPYEPETIIVRCQDCRKISRPWICPSTGKIGP